jgi:hypothetical protein
LDEQVRRLLETPERLEPDLGRVQPLLRTWDYPAFGAPRVWLLWKERRQRFEFLRLRRVVWDRKQALEELRATDADVDGERWQAFEDAAAGIVIPPLRFPLRGVGVDGGWYGVEQSFFNSSLRLQWWARPPDEWKPLARWTEQVREFFEETLAP